MRCFHSYAFCSVRCVSSCLSQSYSSCNCQMHFIWKLYPEVPFQGVSFGKPFFLNWHWSSVASLLQQCTKVWFLFLTPKKSKCKRWNTIYNLSAVDTAVEAHPRVCHLTSDGAMRYSPTVLQSEAKRRICEALSIIKPKAMTVSVMSVSPLESIGLAATDTLGSIRWLNITFTVTFPPIHFQLLKNDVFCSVSLIS